MAFDVKTLVTDRTQADVDTLRTKIQRGLTPAELAEFLKAGDKGAYNYTDLNRVNAACVYLRDELKKYGYTVDVQLPQIEDVVPGETVLPAGYVELSYIESTGTQYIDTGFKPNNNTRVTMDAHIQKMPSGATYIISLGAHEPQAYFQLRIISSQTYLTSDYGNNTVNLANIPLPGRYVIDKNKNVCTVGSVSVKNTANTFQSNSNLWLFGGTTTAGAHQYTSAKLYSCKVYDNETLTRDFVPCRNNTNVVGLYDAVGKKFYANAGTGVFMGGAEIPPVVVLREEWKLGDLPTAEQLNRYLLNVNNVRQVMSVDGTKLPADMNHMKYESANEIERVLVAVEDTVQRIIRAFFYSGEIFSGEV